MKKRYLDFAVKGQFMAARQLSVVADSRNYLMARFTFDADWERLEKTAVFQAATGQVYYVLVRDNMCAVPHEVIQVPWFRVSVFGGDRLTANRIEITVCQSGYAMGETPPEPTPDIYNQMMEQLAAERKRAEEAAVQAAVSAQKAAASSASAQMAAADAEDAALDAAAIDEARQAVEAICAQVAADKAAVDQKSDQAAQNAQSAASAAQQAEAAEAAAIQSAEEAAAASQSAASEADRAQRFAQGMDAYGKAESDARYLQNITAELALDGKAVYAVSDAEALPVQELILTGYGDTPDSLEPTAPASLPGVISQLTTDITTNNGVELYIASCSGPIYSKLSPTPWGQPAIFPNGPILGGICVEVPLTSGNSYYPEFTGLECSDPQCGYTVTYLNAAGTAVNYTSDRPFTPPAGVVSGVISYGRYTMSADTTMKADAFRLTEIRRLPLTAPLYALGELADIYDITTGEEVRRVDVQELAGTESWVNMGSSEEYVNFAISSILHTAPSVYWCSHFPAGSSGTGNALYTQSTGVVVRVRYDTGIIHKGTEIADFKAWLAARKAAGTPVTILYNRPSPNTTQHGPMTLQLYRDETHLTFSAPVWGSMKYTVNHRAVLDQVNRRLEDICARLEALEAG